MHLHYDSPTGLFLLFLAGIVASGINAFAGGGTLVSFPVLIGLGVPELQSNATNSMALWPGSLASAFGFRERWEATKSYYAKLIPATILGSTCGALLLILTPSGTFKILIPFLILLATIILAFQPQIKTWVLREHGKVSPWTGAILQCLISVYGGYFGAGMGIMMLAAMAIFVDGEFHDMNALKNSLAVIINVIAMGWFLSRGLVLLQPCLFLMCGAVIGGFASARISQKISSEKLRTAVVIYGFVMALWFFVRLFLRQ